MKARVITSPMKIQKTVDEEVQKAIKGIQDKVVKDTAYQIMGVMLYVLSRDFGFGKGRLSSLKDKTEQEFVFMASKPCGLDYTNDHVLEFLKQKYGIDFDESCFGENWDNERSKYYE